MSTEKAEEAPHFGDRLKALRKSRKLTQGELAARAGISRDTLSRYERGEVSPTIDALTAIMSALGPDTSADWLLFGAPEDLEREPVRMLSFGSLVGLRFDRGGVAEVSMGQPEVARIIRTLREIEAARPEPDKQVLEALELVLNHLYEEKASEIELLAEVVIAAHAARLIPHWPQVEKPPSVAAKKE